VIWTQDPGLGKDVTKCVLLNNTVSIKRLIVLKPDVDQFVCFLQVVPQLRNFGLSCLFDYCESLSQLFISLHESAHLRLEEFYLIGALASSGVEY
jgi:hypothetical protein